MPLGSDTDKKFKTPHSVCVIRNDNIYSTTKYNMNRINKKKKIVGRVDLKGPNSPQIQTIFNILTVVG